MHTMARTSRKPPQQGRGAAWQLAQIIKERITTGEYPPGSRLPTYRELMKEYDLTSGTVSYAMSILAEQGHVLKRHGSGVFAQSPSEPIPQNELGESLGESVKTRAGLVALVVPEIKSGLYLSLQAGMESALQKKSEQLITVTTSADSRQQADVILQLVDRNVAGIALVPPYGEVPAHQLRLLHRLSIPLVLLHRGVTGVHAPVIAIPFEAIGRLAGLALGKHGHRQVGMLIGMHSDAGESYLRGFRSGLRPSGAELTDDGICWVGFEPGTAEGNRRQLANIEAALTRLLKQPNRPTAVFATSDRMGELTYLAAMQLGLRVPDDLSIICFGSKDRGGAILPRLATIAVDEYETGRKACEILSAMRDQSHPLMSDERIEMPYMLDIAESLGAPPHRSTEP